MEYRLKFVSHEITFDISQEPEDYLMVHVVKRRQCWAGKNKNSPPVKSNQVCSSEPKNKIYNYL